jgi:hypothetical protein
MKHPQAILRMFMLSSVLTMLGYAWLVLPPAWTRTPSPAVAAFATGIGFSPRELAPLYLTVIHSVHDSVLLVILVPQLVPLKFVSTTLGVHKSVIYCYNSVCFSLTLTFQMEQTGATIFQTIAGLVLDGKGSRASQGEASTTQQLLNVFLVFNVLQLIGIVSLSHLDRRRREAADTLQSAVDDQEEAEHESEEESTFTGGEGDILASEIGPLSYTDQRKPLLGPRPRADSGASYSPSSCPPKGVGEHSEIRRGRIFMCLCAVLICCAWVLFLSTAWSRLRSREERGVS